VAKARFRSVTGLLLLRIDASRVGQEIRYEESEPGERFPHIYGPLNTDAVIDAVTFEPGPDGELIIPSNINALEHAGAAQGENGRRRPGRPQ
jgi:uncharacterized protein (DUF952 family)